MPNDRERLPLPEPDMSSFAYSNHSNDYMDGYERGFERGTEEMRDYAAAENAALRNQVKVLQPKIISHAPDCRTCRMFYTAKAGVGCGSYINCTNGDMHEALPVIQLWKILK